MFNLERFIKAQECGDSYNTAISEIKNGLKCSHWIWYVFPQIRGLGRSQFSYEYGISSLQEAKAYLENEVLNDRLREAVLAMMAHEGNRSAEDVLGPLDAKKFRSCLTLFDIVSPDDIYAEALKSLFGGKKCSRTEEIVNKALPKVE